ncbi:caspase family protein [Chloroflexi bacterium TSY]|nr:caspase family protein [Chloroflexi bacterium TSY]
MPLKIATLDDIIMQLRAYDGRHPDYILWLGAGASVTSGIPSASGIVHDLLSRVYAQHIGISIADAIQRSPEVIQQWATQNLNWFDPQERNRSTYAQVMENVYLSSGVRTRYLVNLMEHAQHSDGYRYLGRLLQQGIFDTILTTNFDHLVRQGADPLLTLPLVEVRSLEQYPRLQPYPDQPQIIRLHGDFWHGNVLNIEGEFEQTPFIRYEAVTRLLRAYGLIVIGYSGQDRMIMRKLFDPLVNDPMICRNGIYWCHRKGDPLSPRVEIFLDKLPEGQAFLVEIDGFDETMMQLNHAFGFVNGPSSRTNPSAIDGEERTSTRHYFGTGSRWAVLVGVNHYDDQQNYGQLHVCIKDMQALYSQLTAGGFERSRLRTLADDTKELPSRENILATLKSVADATEPNDLLLFYYSGHGDEIGNESYLVARNGQRIVLHDTAVSISRIQSIMSAAPARAKVMIIDACHSGANIGSKGSKRMSADFIRRVFENATGMAVLASCQQGQLSYEWREQERSVFTHFLLSALQGEADMDKKGFVTVQDINRYVINGVKLWASQNKVNQTPTLQYAVSGDIILTYLH